MGASRPTWAEGRRKGLLFLHSPGSGLQSGRAQGGLPGGGRCAQRPAQGTSGWYCACAYPGATALSHPEVHGAAARPHGKKRREAPNFCVHHQHSASEDCLKKSLWLALFRPFNFLLLSMNNETERFPVSGPQPPLLRNLGLNCWRGTFTFYKLAPLKMLKRL